MRRGITKAVFVDISAFIASAFPRPVDLEQARAIMAMIRTAKRQLITTNFIMAELHALALARRGRTFALGLLDEVVGGATLIERVTEEDQEHALAIPHRYDDKDFSHTDATSSSVVDRLDIGDSFAFDRHFAQFGLRLIGTG